MIRALCVHLKERNLQIQQPDVLGRLQKKKFQRLCSSRDGVHLGPEKDTCRQDSLSKWID
jgi:hypothetical protein